MTQRFCRMDVTHCSCTPACLLQQKTWTSRWTMPGVCRPAVSTAAEQISLCPGEMHAALLRSGDMQAAARMGPASGLLDMPLQTPQVRCLLTPERQDHRKTILTRSSSTESSFYTSSEPDNEAAAWHQATRKTSIHQVRMLLYATLHSSELNPE